MFAELRGALIAVGDAWEGDSVLPKSLVNVLVGLFSWIDSASYLYEDDEKARIQQAAREVDTLIFRHIVPAGDVGDVS